MTKLEKYKKEFLEAYVRGMAFEDCTTFRDKAGVNIDFCNANPHNCYACSNKIAEWLLEEYKEPEPELLENGDALIVGEYIMVRDDEADDWKERQFLFYYQNHFYCISKGHELDNHVCVVQRWVYARLPIGVNKEC